MDGLRRQLRERFPEAHGVGLAGRMESAAEAGGEEVLTLDGLVAGELVEVVSAGPAGGLGLWMAGLLDGAADAGGGAPAVVLVDGADGFDPSSHSGEACSRLLWVRCGSALEMVKAADLLVRDGNVPVVLVDAGGLGAEELRGLPASAWWRLKQAAEGSGCRLVVMASWPLVPCAGRRLVISADLELEDFERTGDELRGRLRVVPERLSRAR